MSTGRSGAVPAACPLDFPRLEGVMGRQCPQHTAPVWQPHPGGGITGLSVMMESVPSAPKIYQSPLLRRVTGDPNASREAAQSTAYPAGTEFSLAELSRPPGVLQKQALISQERIIKRRLVEAVDWKKRSRVCTRG